MNTNKKSKFSFKPFALIAGRIMLIILSIFCVCIIILIGVLWIMSPGNPEPYLDEKGKQLQRSVSEKIFININGVEQGMFIKGKDVTKPVLLFLHGGMPEYFFTQSYPTGLEDIFTVCWWEQRGSGLSYLPDMPKESITTKQLISDTKEVTNYLRHRFGKEKIYLMGHSGGSFIGIKAAAESPELYYAYIGVAQMSYQLKSEVLAYEYMLKRFKENGNKVMEQKLESAKVTITDGTPSEYLALRDEGMHSLGIGTMHNMKSVITGIFFPSLACRDYTLTEKIRMWRGKATAGVSVVWKEILASDLSKQVCELKIPVYFFEGIFDYTCSYKLAKEYFEKLKTPVKGFYTFEKSAHSPLFEEPKKMQNILRKDVLLGDNKLGDRK